MKWKLEDGVLWENIDEEIRAQIPAGVNLAVEDTWNYIGPIEAVARCYQATQGVTQRYVQDARKEPG